MKKSLYTVSIGLHAQAMNDNTEPKTEEICKRCHGQGFTIYGSTATWHGGIGGAAMTEDVCDKCWGTGYTSHPGPNRRKGEHPTLHARLAAEVAELRKENEQQKAKVARLDGQSKTWQEVALNWEKKHDEQTETIKRLTKALTNLIDSIYDPAERETMDLTELEAIDKAKSALSSKP